MLKSYLLYCQARFTPGWKSTECTRRWADLWNDLSFSLCAAPSVCCVVATSDEGGKSEYILRTSTLVWTVPDSIIRLPSLLSLLSSSVCNPFHVTLKVQMASSRRNSSTPVPPLGTPFNTISRFSEPIAYLPNAPWRSRQIHQRDRSSPRSPSSTIQPARTVSPVPGPSIIPMDNDPNWEDAPTTNLNNNNIANRPMSSTCSRSKPRRSDNTNEQLAKVLSWLANTLNTNQTPAPNTNSRGTKACISDTFSSTEPDKLNNFLFQCRLYFCANPAQFDTDIAKINFAITYLTGVAQDWFEVGLNQED